MVGVESGMGREGRVEGKRRREGRKGERGAMRGGEGRGREGRERGKGVDEGNRVQNGIEEKKEERDSKSQIGGFGTDWRNGGNRDKKHSLMNTHTKNLHLKKITRTDMICSP